MSSLSDRTIREQGQDVADVALPLKGRPLPGRARPPAEHLRQQHGHVVQPAGVLQGGPYRPECDRAPDAGGRAVLGRTRTIEVANSGKKESSRVPLRGHCVTRR
jgi:hypothetical protein